MIIEVLSRLTSDGTFSSAGLGRARLLHDVANRADSALERAAASGQLVDMFNKTIERTKAPTTWTPIASKRPEVEPDQKFFAAKDC